MQYSLRKRAALSSRVGTADFDEGCVHFWQIYHHISCEGYKIVVIQSRKARWMKKSRLIKITV